MEVLVLYHVPRFQGSTVSATFTGHSFLPGVSSSIAVTLLPALPSENHLPMNPLTPSSRETTPNESFSLCQLL